MCFSLPTLTELEAVHAIVDRAIATRAQYAWPLRAAIATIAGRKIAPAASAGNVDGNVFGRGPAGTLA